MWTTARFGELAGRIRCLGTTSLALIKDEMTASTHDAMMTFHKFYNIVSTCSLLTSSINVTQIAQGITLLFLPHRLLELLGGVNLHSAFIVD
jgi:hypothetical protein